MVIFLVVVCVLASGLTFYNIKNKKVSIKPKVTLTKPNEVSIKPDTVLQKPIVQDSDKKAEDTKPNEVISTPPSQEKFPYDQVINLMSAENYNDLYKILLLWKDKNIDDESKLLLIKAEEQLKSKAIAGFYSTGLNYFKEKDFKNAIEYFNRVYLFGKENLYFQHGLYFLGKSNEESGNNSQAFKYYEEYNATFPNGSYEETVLYNLSMMYRNTDIVKAKQFAKILAENFSDSDYNNSNISEILSK